MGLTQREAAYRAGVSLTRWQRLEAGGHAGTARAISRVLGPPADDVGPLVEDVNVVFVNDPRITPRQVWRLCRMAEYFGDVQKHVLPYLPQWVRFVVNEQWMREFSHLGVEVGERLAENLKVRKPPTLAEAMVLWIAVEREKDLLEDRPDQPDDALVDLGSRDSDWNTTRKALLHRATIGKIELLYTERGAILSVANKDSTWHPFLWWNATEV